MFSFNRSWFAVAAALTVAAVPVLFYSGHAAAGQVNTAEPAKLTQAWLGERVPVRLPDIVITAKRSVEFAGPRQAGTGRVQG